MQDWKKEINKVYYWISSPRAGSMVSWVEKRKQEWDKMVCWVFPRYVTGIQFVLNIAPMFKMNNQQITKAFLSLYFLTNPYLILCFFLSFTILSFFSTMVFLRFLSLSRYVSLKMLTNVSGVLVKGHNNIVKLSSKYISSF
jgi:hypothetical protein